MPRRRSRIADAGLAAEGERRIAWAREHMPVLSRLARGPLADGSLAGAASPWSCTSRRRLPASYSRCVEAGAQVVAAGSNPLSTQDAVCAALVERGVEVHARHGVPADEFTDDLLAVAATQPELVIDDGLELTRRMAEHAPDVYERLAGVSEETTTGVARLRALEAAGRLRFPAIAANDARCKHLFDNPYGTGQTTLTALLALTNVLAAGREFCVVGYGWVGQGRRARRRRAGRARHGRRGRSRRGARPRTWTATASPRSRMRFPTPTS